MVTRALTVAQVQAPDGYFYSSHSPWIGGYNELRMAGLSRERIMARLDWETESMMRVYMDSRLTVTAQTSYFFAHVLDLG